MELKVDAVDHVAITVRDIPRSIEWYTRVLGLEHRSVAEWGEYPQMLYAGDACLALFPADGDNPSPPPGSDTISMRHVAFRVGRAAFDGASDHFASLGIDSRFADHGVAHSLYISDPDGHAIEITTYEV